MGNCQAIDAAALVIQHPDGRLQRMYWPVSASEVMRANPGHYVSVIIPLQPEADGGEEGEEEGRKKKKPKTVRFTRVKILRPTDTLALGHAYRLVTSQEVMKVLRAKKNGKTKQQQQKPQQQKDEVVVVVVPEHGKSCQNGETGEVSNKENSDSQNQEGMKQHQMQGQGMQPAAAAGSGRRSKTWRPSLQSIDEGFR